MDGKVDAFGRLKSLIYIVGNLWNSFIQYADISPKKVIKIKSISNLNSLRFPNQIKNPISVKNYIPIKTNETTIT